MTDKKNIIEVVMKNYYEILQVNENASIEIIEKAYKVLAKKYHPDLQKDYKMKEFTEQKLKQINEAYDVLSNEFLKEQYDIELQREKEERLKKQYGNDNYQTEKTNFYTTEQTKSNIGKNQNKKRNTVSNNNKPKYEEVGSLKSVIDLVKILYEDRPRREHIKEVTKKDIIAVLLTIVVVAIIGFVLWCIPFTNGWIRELLFDNPIFKWIDKTF